MSLSSSNALTIIYSSTLSKQLQRFVTLAECLGIEAKCLDVAASSDIEAVLAAGSGGPGAFVLDVESVSAKLPNSESVVRSGLRDSAHSVLLLITSPTAHAIHYVFAVTEGSVSAGPLEGASDVATCRFSSSLSAELQGHSFDRSALSALALLPRNDYFETALSIGPAPTFGRLNHPNFRATVLIWGTPRIFDMRRPLDSELEFEHATEEYVPGMIFMRMAFGKKCWHAPEATAAFIIDDPLLKRSYGLLDFEKLLASARRNDFHVTLAFIPWNHWRTKLRDAALFRGFSDVFSICVHGNDHTRGEFFSGDRDNLAELVGEAHARMESHRQRTGLPYLDVMVYPQERYSVAALRAISDSRHFSAVVNSRCIPNDPSARGTVCGEDLLHPATDNWFGVPILKRHFASDGMSKFALALFLGRPAVLAGHHAFFKAGIRRIEAFAGELKRIRPDVRWPRLGDVLRRLCLVRWDSESHCMIRFFLPEFECHLNHSIRYTFTTRVCEENGVEGVTVDDVPVEYELKRDLLSFSFVANRTGVSAVRVLCGYPHEQPSRGSMSYRAGAAARRFLSEIRDELLASYVRATRWTNSFARRLIPLWVMQVLL